MAEFKLGRIRFVWQGAWAPGNTYIVDDVISNGGKSYICAVNHTASATFDTDLSFVPSKWNIVADGVSWRGDWLPTHLYNAGDIVKYGALVYVCNTGHTSSTYQTPTWYGLEGLDKTTPGTNDDIGYWDLFATSFEFKTTWDVSTRYKKNDIVNYGGTTYVCKTPHISAVTINLGLEHDSYKWDVFNQGITYLSDWSASSVRYKLNDVVKYGADLWICTAPHVSNDFILDQANWSVFVNGLQFENSWNNSTTYQVGDTVTYGGYSYIAKTNHINSVPTSIGGAANWNVFTTGFSFQGEWDNTSNYKVGDVVRLHGYTFVATADSVNNIPPDTDYWSRLNSGTYWTTNSVSHLAVSGTNIIGSGTGAKFDVVQANTRYAITVSAGFLGANYSNGDTIKILGTNVGGLSPVNDIIITVAGSTSGAINSITWTGYSSSWTTGTSYVLGDVVIFGGSSYICVEPHIADFSTRPDQDTTGNAWNLLTAGSEANFLTTQGDIVYYGQNGPQRLPIGINGQVLRSNDGYPLWANYGLINNIVYVGPLGNDLPYPSAGATIDQPWKSVRFAAKQIEEGYLNPNAKSLLQRNKQFLMKEVTNWITYTYTVSITEANHLSNNAFTTTPNGTANLAAGMPIKFSGTVGGVVAGTTYYVKTVLDTSHFTISNTLTSNARTLNSETNNMTGTLSYDSTYCERDVGIIADAVLYDLTHGGTAKSTKAALAYFTTAGNAYINSNFGTQITQTVAAYNFLKQLMANVVSNTAPAQNYQLLNGVVNIAEQIIDNSITVESGIAIKINSLVGIITTGLSAGVSTAIPTAINANTSISVKTGTYLEVLPIVVPENTAVVGDELRSTVVQPKPANPLLVNDNAKTASALNRIKSVIPNLIANVPVKSSTGNTVPQQYLYTSSEATATSAIGAKIITMLNIVSNGLSSVPTFVIPDPTGYDSGYSNARRLVLANKTFLQAEECYKIYYLLRYNDCTYFFSRLQYRH
jgi:hypothetical protein